MRLPLSRISSSLALPTLLTLLTLLPVLPVHAFSQVEGRVAKSANADGRYDLLIRVWDRSGNAGPSLVQTIQISKVDVVRGFFKITLDAGLEMHTGRELTFEIETRPFEAYIPFKTAEIHRVLIAVI